MGPPEKNLNILFIPCQFNLKFLEFIEEIILNICAKFNRKIIDYTKSYASFSARNCDFSEFALLIKQHYQLSSRFTF